MADPDTPQTRNVVLVVDDEITVLRIASATLSAAGFQVEVAGNGADGLAQFRYFRDQICLVLSDVVMPELGGIDMAEKILESYPETKILLMSGYSDAAMEVQARNRFPFVRKPFLPADLVSRIRRLLAEAATASD
jgi:DNA-binding NtrC family response regulator